ncbi:unnamed protein product [Bursaphelenchus xylophilus]|uniref:(pine wood nematode) hypothetical protein n=1 Tax=Bursaphelenchus xylophilus TaxID=6326 RepID=A0A1I7RKA7_BURXY|nr:unnamed protein product [Bursaphelenchus xylophilus]CAG9131399.1 unnamed protein product [Bursaphelenchus xylophilus]
MGILLNATELPSKDLLAVYHAFEYAMFAFTILIVGYTLTVMSISPSKGLGKYKWYLIHGIIWGFFFDAMSSLIGAVTLFPLPCYYGVNLASKITGNMQIFYFWVGANCMIGKIYATFIQFEHRFQQALPLDSWYRTFLGFLHGRYEIHIRVLLYLFVFATVNIPWVMLLPNQEDQRSFLSNMDPVLAWIYHENPSTTCFSGGVSSLIANIAAAWGALLVLAQVFLLFFIYVSIHQSKFTPNTYRLQMMLFWSLVAQMVVLFVFMMGPGILYLAGATLGLRNMPRISVYCFFFFVSHTTVDSLMLLFFIKPYRRVVLLSVRRILNTTNILDQRSTVSGTTVEIKMVK